jgi:carbamoyltransferase
LLENERRPEPGDLMRGSYLGPEFSNDEILAFLRERGIAHHFHGDETEVLARTVDALIEEKVVGWFHGRMEFGPRALGGRSILGDPRSVKMQSVMNVRIKYRESFRPFAPIVLAEDATHYFNLEGESPYMLLVAPVRQEQLLSLTDEQRRTMLDPDLRKRVNVPRSTIPAVTHVDGSARIQTMSEARNGRGWRLLRAFKERTDCGVLVNTSFNIRGEPIVCTPEDAWRCFMASDMDVLVLENCILYKTEQPETSRPEREKYLASFALD